MKVLLVEGDAHYAQWLAEKLGAAGFRIQVVPPEAGTFASREAQAALAAIIDADRDGLEAWEAIRRARSSGIEAPLLVISGRENWREKVDCLNAGADDYLVKPIRSEEISARLRAVIRRSAGRCGDRFVHGPLTVDLRERVAWLDDQLLDLTRNEFRLASRMVMWPERVHATSEILELIRQSANDGTCSANAVEVLVTRLRRKIGRETIRTVRGVGYQLAAADQINGTGLAAFQQPKRAASPRH